LEHPVRASHRVKEISRLRRISFQVDATGDSDVILPSCGEGGLGKDCALALKINTSCRLLCVQCGRNGWTATRE